MAEAAEERTGETAPVRCELAVLACSPRRAPLDNVVLEGLEASLHLPASVLCGGTFNDLCRLLGRRATQRFLFAGHANARFGSARHTLGLTTADGRLAPPPPFAIAALLGRQCLLASPVLLPTRPFILTSLCAIGTRRATAAPSSLSCTTAASRSGSPSSPSSRASTMSATGARSSSRRLRAFCARRSSRPSLAAIEQAGPTTSGRSTKRAGPRRRAAPTHGAMGRRTTRC